MPYVRGNEKKNICLGKSLFMLLNCKVGCSSVSRHNYPITGCGMPSCSRMPEANICGGIVLVIGIAPPDIRGDVGSKDIDIRVVDLSGDTQSPANIYHLLSYN